MLKTKKHYYKSFENINDFTIQRNYKTKAKNIYCKI